MPCRTSPKEYTNKRTRFIQRPIYVRANLYHLRSELTAITHVDYSARLQTINEKTNKSFHELVTTFKEN